MTQIDTRDPETTLQIRPAQRSDSARLLEMVTALAAHHGDAATLSPGALDRDVFGPTACARALMAEAGNDVVGYALLCPALNLHFGLRLMDLNHLYVAPTHRGRGIARRLIAASVEEARRQGCGRLTVGTHPDNTQAQEIYRALGFDMASGPGPRFRLDLPATGALPAGWV